MNSLTITQKTSETERYIPNEVITTLYNIGKDDDENQSLTSGVDTTDSNRPVTSVVGSVAVRAAYVNQINYLATKFPKLNISADATYIYFKDREVEKILIAAGIGDGIGITTTDAATANISRTIFASNVNITKFDEFPLFTRMNGQAMDFGGCINLESIDLSNVTTLWLNNNNYCSFNGCSKLKTIGTLPEGITSIPLFFVNNCSSLESINIPSTCTTIYTGAFRGANLLTFNGSDFVNVVDFQGNAHNEMFPSYSIQGDVLDLSNCTHIASRVFYQQNFKKVLLPQLTTWNGNEANQTFGNCPLLKEVYMPNLKYTSSVLNEYGPPFNNSTGIEKITISNQATMILQYFFNGLQSLKYANIPDTIVSVGQTAFDGQGSAFQNRILNLPLVTNGNFYMQFKNREQMHIYLPSLTKTSVSYGVYNNDPNQGWLCYRNDGSTIRTLYFRDIQQFGAGSFNRCTINTIVINNTTVPTLAYHTNSTLGSRDPDFNVYVFHGLYNASTVNIYVPDSAVADYQAAPQFADVASRIKGLSDSSLHHITDSEIHDIEEDGEVPTYEENGVTKPLWGQYCTSDGIIDKYAI